MNLSIAKGNWQRLHGALLSVWGTLTGDPLRVVAGRHRQIAGRLHVAKFDHALMPLADKATAAQLSVGPLAYGGAANVPRAATYRRADYQLFAGASFRMVLDVGNWDASRTINTPGQSGDPFSAHYRDLAPLWAAGQYVPLLYSRSAVEAATAEAISLTPR